MIILIILKNITNKNYLDKEEFYNKINNKNISDEDYNHAKNVFEKFKCAKIY